MHTERSNYDRSNRKVALKRNNGYHQHDQSAALPLPSRLKPSASLNMSAVDFGVHIAEVGVA